MKIVINAPIVNDSEWPRFSRRALRHDANSLLVELADLQRYPRYFRRSNLKLGINLNPDTDIGELVDWLPRLGLVQLNFLSFADGRPFTQARLLRERYGYLGDIRANGEVLRDQLAFMRRCGINQFNLAEGEDIKAALAAFDDISDAYQPDGNQPGRAAL